MKNFVDYTSRKCFASARVAPPRLAPRLRNIHSHSQKVIFWTCDPNNYCTRLSFFIAFVLLNCGKKIIFWKSRQSNVTVKIVRFILPIGITTSCQLCQMCLEFASGTYEVELFSVLFRSLWVFLLIIDFRKYD